VRQLFAIERTAADVELIYRAVLGAPRARSASPDDGKRALDLAGAVVLLVVAGPALAAAAVAIWATMGAPVVYRQRRTGSVAGSSPS
jgi:lipopolysaccharide/colanic/teichoic acid biosynthesis glycosyltransferase